MHHGSLGGRFGGGTLGGGREIYLQCLFPTSLTTTGQDSELRHVRMWMPSMPYWSNSAPARRLAPFHEAARDNVYTTSLGRTYVQAPARTLELIPNPSPPLCFALRDMSFARYDLGAKKPSWTRGATQGLMAGLGRWGLNELSSDNLTPWHLSKTTRAIRRPSEKDSAADENCSHPKESPWEVYKKYTKKEKGKGDKWGTFPYVPVLHYSLNGAVGYVLVLHHSSKSDPPKS